MSSPLASDAGLGAQIADWQTILKAEPSPLNLAFLQRLDKHLHSSSFLPALAFEPTEVDRAAADAVGHTAFDAAALPNLARWLRAVAPNSGAKAIAAPLPASAIFGIDISAALAAESKGRAVSAPPAAAGGAAAASAAVAGGKDAAKADKKGAAAAAKGVAPAAAAAAGGKDAAAAKPAKEKKEKAAAAAPAEVSQVYRVDFRVGRVVSVAPHPTEARLSVLQVDVGADLGGARTVVAGVAEYFSAEVLTNSLVVVMVNVKSGDVKGVESFGRIMVATSADGAKKELPVVPAAAKVGEQITFASVPAGSKPDQPLAPKRLHEIMKLLHTNADKHVQYANDDFQTSAGPVVVPTIADGTVA
jgi:tRNA-binding EMAP/Myf-like protein